MNGLTVEGRLRRFLHHPLNRLAGGIPRWVLSAWSSFQFSLIYLGLRFCLGLPLGRANKILSPTRLTISLTRQGREKVKQFKSAFF
jgi:hypothetical protein